MPHLSIGGMLGLNEDLAFWRPGLSLGMVLFLALKSESASILRWIWVVEASRSDSGVLIHGTSSQVRSFCEAMAFCEEIRCIGKFLDLIRPISPAGQ